MIVILFYINSRECINKFMECAGSTWFLRLMIESFVIKYTMRTAYTNELKFFVEYESQNNTYDCITWATRFRPNTCLLCTTISLPCIVCIESVAARAFISCIVCQIKLIHGCTFEVPTNEFRQWKKCNYRAVIWKKIRWNWKFFSRWLFDNFFFFWIETFRILAHSALVLTEHINWFT